MKNKIQKNNQTKQFVGLLTTLMLVSFAVHVNVNDYLFEDLYANSVILSYSVNFIIAAALFVLFIKYLDRIKNTLGFYFMGGSFFKFLIFFLVFQPIFKEEGSTSKAEFASFFIPYVISLSLEVYFLVKILNKEGI